MSDHNVKLAGHFQNLVRKIMSDDVVVSSTVIGFGIASHWSIK